MQHLICSDEGAVGCHEHQAAACVGIRGGALEGQVQACGKSQANGGAYKGLQAQELDDAACGLPLPPHHPL